MSLRNEIKDYTDCYGLVSPRKLPIVYSVGRTSDNGVMYLTDYLLMLQSNHEFTLQDRTSYFNVLETCLNQKGNLCRSPGGIDQDSVDNHYALFAASVALKYPFTAIKVKNAMLSNKGFTNNEQPGTIYRVDGTINWDAFLVRQPQLMAAMMSASNTKKFYHAPLYWYAALVLATSCSRIDRMVEYFGETKGKLSLLQRLKGMYSILRSGDGIHAGNTDARRLSWLLMQAVEDSSVLCRIAARIWCNRLIKHYGPDGMKAVNTIYFGPDHPITKYSTAF